jgi:preprotein translocase SecE subunit
MISLKYKKPGEGIYTRTFIAIYILLIVLRLTLSLYSYGEIHFLFWSQPLFGNVSLGEFGFTNGKIIAIFLFGLLSLAAYIIINSERVVNFLIETQNELAIVTSPSRKEYLGASFAVLVVVALLAIYLSIVDGFFTLVLFK